MAVNRKDRKQLNFWIKKEKLKRIDKFVKEKRFHTRTDFLLRALDVVFDSPELLDNEYLKKLLTDRQLLFELIKLFDKIPCQFDFDARPHEIDRIQEIQKELGLSE